MIVLATCAQPKAGDFAIHLVSGYDDPRTVDKAALDEIQMENPALLKGQDIISYDLTSHTIELTEEAYDRIKSLFTLPVDTDGIPFMVAVSNKPIYSGAFYSPASSLSFNGVVIMQPMSDGSNTISIELGYPCPAAFEGSDPRSDPRIVDALIATQR